MQSHQIVKLELLFIDNNDPRKNVDYIGTLDQYNNINDLVGLIVPIESAVSSDYNLEQLIQHIRLDQNNSFNKIKIIVLDKDIGENNDILEKEFSPDVILGSEDKEPSEPITKEKWKREVNKINDEPRPSSGDRHDLANKWGVYRLHRFLNNYGISNENFIKVYKKELANDDLFFKKQLYKEASLKNNYSPPDDIKKILEQIRQNFNKVALVDDLADFGWTEAFTFIFGQNKVDTFKSVKEFSAINKDKWKTYDLILLDLRLEGEINKPNTVLSGNKLLKKIKNISPDIPVIITTASNKYHSFRDSIDYGANEFWVKESHELGVNQEYNQDNSLKLLTSIKKIIKWNKTQRKLISLLNKIEDTIFDIHQEKGIQRRKAFVIAQIYNRSSSFLEGKLGDTTIEASFISIYSMLNEILKYYFPEPEPNENDEGEKNKFTINYYDGIERELLAYEIRNKNGYKYEINPSLHEKIINSYWKGDINWLKVHYLIFKKNSEEDFFKIIKMYHDNRKKRNNLNITHGNFDEATSTNLELQDLINLATVLKSLT